jgi:hypothetical protein
LPLFDLHKELQTFSYYHRKRNKMLLKSLTALSFASAAIAHGSHDHDQEPMTGPLQSLWYNTLPGDGGKQVKASSTGEEIIVNQF